MKRMNGVKNDYNGVDPKVRKAALVEFWNKMQSYPELRKACTDTQHPEEAIKAGRQALKDAGNFRDDPNGIDSVEVRVYESKRETADKIVTLVIPEEFDPQWFNPAKFWRCSWNLWNPRKRTQRKKR